MRIACTWDPTYKDIMSIITFLFLTAEEVKTAQNMATDTRRLHGIGAVDKLEARRKQEPVFRQRRIIRRAMEMVDEHYTQYDEYNPNW